MQVAREEGRPDADVDGQPVVEELAAIFAGDLVEDGVGLAVALLQVDAAVDIGFRIVDREDVDRLAIVLEQADFAGLAVMRVVERIADAQRVVVVDVPAQAGDHAVAVGLGLARRQHGDRSSTSPSPLMSRPK